MSGNIFSFNQYLKNKIKFVKSGSNPRSENYPKNLLQLSDIVHL